MMMIMMMMMIFVVSSGKTAHLVGQMREVTPAAPKCYVDYGVDNPSAGLTTLKRQSANRDGDGVEKHH